MAALAFTGAVAVARPGPTATPGPVRDSGGSVGSPVPILMFHHVAPASDAAARRSGLWVSPARFERHMGALARAGYRAVTLDQVWRAWHAGASLPRRSVVLSFDDGYPDLTRNAAPVLRARGWPGVLNLITSRLDAAGGLRRTDVLELIGEGWEIGAHTATHPDLTRVRDARLRREVAGSRAGLISQLGTPIRAFCYPYGRFSSRVRAAVLRAGYETAMTIRRGLAGPSDDPLALPRLNVGARMSSRLLIRMVRTSASRMAAAR